MPELPDIVVYIEALERRIVGRRLQNVVIKNPFLLRSVDPPISACVGQEVRTLRRLGKRIGIGLGNDVWMILHLMIAGRLHWYDRDRARKVRPALLYLEFESGVLTLTEAGTKRRASLHLIQGEAALAEFDRGGLEVLEHGFAEFRDRMQERNHTLKRALTDPTILSGIGNAYSDEILHRAQLSTMTQTKSLSDAEWVRLHEATRATLLEWTQRLREETNDRFPEKVTAFREEMAAHGRYGKPCPVCGTLIQRIRYAENETNYCPRCQTGGKMLADRALSRLLKDDWPKSVEEWEKGKGS
jgi:formamidopyrimidine-DNA glycosylase